jgi:hypothetical protein
MKQPKKSSKTFTNHIPYYQRDEAKRIAWSAAQTCKMPAVNLK